MMKTAIKHKSRRFRRFLWANEAVSALEYAVLVGVVVVAVVAGMGFFSDEVGKAIKAIGKTMTDETATTKITTAGKKAGS